MKSNKIVKKFEEYTENLNISDVKNSNIHRDFSKEWDDLTYDEKVSFAGSKDDYVIERNRGWYECWRKKYGYYS